MYGFRHKWKRAKKTCILVNVVNSCVFKDNIFFTVFIEGKMEVASSLFEGKHAVQLLIVKKSKVFEVIIPISSP